MNCIALLISLKSTENKKKIPKTQKKSIWLAFRCTRTQKLVKICNTFFSIFVNAWKKILLRVNIFWKIFHRDRLFWQPCSSAHALLSLSVFILNFCTKNISQIWRKIFEFFLPIVKLLLRLKKPKSCCRVAIRVEVSGPKAF